MADSRFWLVGFWANLLILIYLVETGQSYAVMFFTLPFYLMTMVKYRLKEVNAIKVSDDKD